MKRNPRQIAKRAVEFREQGWSWRKIGEHFGTSHGNIRYWVAKYESGDESSCSPSTPQLKSEREGDLTTVEAKGPTIRTLEQLLDAAEVDQELWRVVKYVTNTWDSKWQVKAWLEPIPQWALDFPKVVIERKEARPLPSTEGAESVLFVPDQQFGFRWDFETGKLEPIHDPVAVALAEAVAREMKPDTIVLAGDVLDFAAFSTKYLVDPSLRQTATPSLQAAHDHIAALAEVAQVIMLPGNHDIRAATAAATLIPELCHLKPANSDAPLLALERLLDLESVSAYVVPGGYPHAELYMFDGLARFNHGTKVKKRGGQTVAAVLEEARVSTFFGHIHRAELAARTHHGPRGLKTVYAGSPGTLSRQDGAVPGSHRPDWQQAVMPIYYRKGRLYPSLVYFDGGEAIWEGRVLSV